MQPNASRWTVTMSRDTDVAVRSFLAENGMTDRDLSAFVEEAVRERIFDQTLAKVRQGFSHMSPEALDALIDEAVSEVRRTKTIAAE